LGNAKLLINLQKSSNEGRRNERREEEKKKGTDFLDFLNALLESPFQSLDGVSVEIHRWVLGVPIDHFIGECVLGVDGVVIGLSPRDTAPTSGASVRVLGVESVLLFNLLQSPLAVGVAFVEIFAGGIAKIGGKKLWWSVRKEGTGRGVTWSLF
jgi:hypothetical protein